jgi:hypothetical protein
MDENATREIVAPSWRNFDGLASTEAQARFRGSGGAKSRHHRLFDYSVRLVDSQGGHETLGE